MKTLKQPRRTLLRAGGAGLLGLTLPGLLRADNPTGATAITRPRARARSVIFLFQFGGPSHHDTFDPKPDAPAEIRGPLGSMASTADGVLVCDRLPRTARVLSKATVIRTMTHTMKNHNSAAYYALTGHAPPVDDIRLRDSIDLYPAYGSVANKLLQGSADMPTAVAFPHVIRDGAVTPGQHASFLGKLHDPFLITQDPGQSDFRLPELSLPAEVSLGRLERRRELRQLVDSQSRLLEYSAAARGLDDYTRRAAAMLASDRVRRAFDLTREPESLRDAYGRHTYGQSCLLARRLVESGARFVTVYFAETIGGQNTTGGGWDTHGFNNTRMYPIIEKYHLPMLDQTLPTLLEDLDQRGLLDDTLVLWMGEFGRTPRLNQNASRDHWPQCYSALLAGGGVKRGFAHGASDATGAYPARDPVRPDDLAATLFQLLGMDPATEVRDPGGRPLPIANGTPVGELIA